MVGGGQEEEGQDRGRDEAADTELPAFFLDELMLPEEEE